MHQFDIVSIDSSIMKHLVFHLKITLRTNLNYETLRILEPRHSKSL